MRAIKFRGKSSHSGEWLYGDLINIHGNCHILGEDDMREDGHHVTQDSDRPTWVEPDTIGQFTSLYDKNGKEIYEGDIIKNGTFVGVVDWNPIGNFFINENYGKRQDKCISLGEMLENHDFIVVGNIHDNPDLKEGGKE